MNTEALSLDPDSLRAEARVRLRDCAVEFQFGEALEALCSSIDQEARCTKDGRRATRKSLVQLLVTQARALTGSPQGLAGSTAAEKSDVAPPVFIIGLPRTGTTFLHNLLAEVQVFRCPKLWELMDPLCPQDPAQEAEAVRSAKDYVAWYYANAAEMAKIHPMDARRPDECQRLLSCAFFSSIYWIRYNVPSYAEWFVKQDGTAAYQLHALLLRKIMKRPPFGVPVLKDPFHLWHLDGLCRVYPSAKFIFLHRDPRVSVASLCSLTSTARRAWSSSIDDHEVALFWVDHIERLSARIRELMGNVRARGSCLDVDYNTLTESPLETLRQIMSFVGLPLERLDEMRARAFLEENPLRRHGTHSYSADQFGLAGAEAQARLAKLGSVWTIAP